MNRRGFLKFASAAPIAAKVAGAQIAEAALGSGVPVGVGGAGILRGGAEVAVSSLGGKSNEAGLIAWFLENGFPDWMKDEMYRDAGYISSLDFDLAANRSMSLTMKAYLQRQRNYKRQLEGRDPRKDQERRSRRSWFYEKFGTFF